MIKKTLAIATILLIVTSTFMMFNLATFAVTTKPANLNIYIGPTSILADNSSYSCVFVQLLDSSGTPTRAEQDTTISLSSSAAGIGAVDQTTTIPKNATYASANFTSTFIPGTTTITATAPNYASINSTLTTIGRYPYATTVHGFPSLLPADGGTYSAIMVQLQDLSGSPARAPNDVQISLFSSNITIGNVTSTITIPQGQTYAIANFTTGAISSDVNVTAVGHGYKSTYTLITTQDATASGSVKQQLKIFEGPPQVLADNNAYKQIAVEMQDTAGNILTATSNTTITVASADNSIATTDPEITILQNSSYALATLYSTYRAGTVNITAATNNFQVAQQQITTVGYTPSQLAVYCVPSELPSDNSTYQAIQVQLQDAQGRPARNPDSNTTVRLFSSNLTVGNVTSEITIPFGQTQATANFTATNTPGLTTIAAIGSNYTTGQTILTTYLIDYLPIQITVTANPGNINGGNSAQVSAYITGDGTPITEAKVTFTSNNGGIFSAIQEGNGYYNTTFTAPNISQITICNITASASKIGYLGSLETTQITVIPTPTPTPTPAPTATPTPTPTASPTATPTPTPTPTNNNGATIQLCIKDLNGLPLNGTSVSSITQPAGTRTLFDITNATGYVTFQNITAGSYTFNIIKEGYLQMSKTIVFNGQSLTSTVYLNSNAGSNNPNDNTLIIVSIAVAAVVIAVVSGLYLVRRRWDISWSSTS